MSHLADRPTRTLQDRREVLLTLPRDLSKLENEELQAISQELERRGCTQYRHQLLSSSV